MLQPNSLLFNYVNVVELARTPLHKYILLGQTQGSNSSLYSFTPWTDEVVRTPLHFDLHREQSKWVTFLSMFIHTVNSRNGSHSSPYYPHREQSKWLTFLSILSTPWTVKMAPIHLYIYLLRVQSKWLTFISLFIHSVNRWNGSHSSLYLSTPWTVEMAHIPLSIYPLREQLKWLTFFSLCIFFMDRLTFSIIIYFVNIKTIWTEFLFFCTSWLDDMAWTPLHMYLLIA